MRRRRDRDVANLYEADSYNHLIRQIVISTRVVTTLEGTGSSGSTDTTTGTLASFNTPTGITTDGTNLYVAYQDSNKVRQIVISTGVVTALAGSGVGGKNNGPGTEATFKQPVGITTDGIDIYVIEKSNHLIRKID